MTKAGEKIIEGMAEALSIARGEQPAARIFHRGHAYVPEQGWQPIETAPKNGAWILGWASSDSSPYRISWGRNHRSELAWCTSFSSFVDGYITHWLPLPPTPVEDDAS